MTTPTLQAQILTAFYEAANRYGPLVLVRVPTAEGEEVRAFSGEDGKLFPTLEEAQQEGLRMVELLREEFAVEAEVGGTVTPEEKPVYLRATIHELVSPPEPKESFEEWSQRLDGITQEILANMEEEPYPPELQQMMAEIDAQPEK